MFLFAFLLSFFLCGCTLQTSAHSDNLKIYLDLSTLCPLPGSNALVCVTPSPVHAAVMALS